MGLLNTRNIFQKSGKGDLTVDFAIGMAFFLVTFAFVLFFLSSYLTTAEPSSEIQQKGEATIGVLLTDGVPSNWDVTGDIVRVGVVKDIYRIPILVESNVSRASWPVEVTIDFERLTNRSTIRVTNFTGQTIPFQVQNRTDPVTTAEVVFISNLSVGRNVFYVYFSNQSNITGTNFTGINATDGSDFASDCSKRVDNGILTFVLCNGTSATNRAGIRSLKDNSQGLEIADSKSIDNPFTFGDMNSNASNFNFTMAEEGPVYVAYKLNFSQGDTIAELYYKFFNGTPVWKVNGSWTGTAENGTQIQMNTAKVFDKKQDSSESSEENIPDAIDFNTADYGMSRNASTNFSLATAIRSNRTNFKFGWQNGTSQLVPHLNSSDNSITADYFTIWHSYGKGNITNASDLYNQPNVTILPRETVRGISIDKVSKLSNTTYSIAKTSLDLGQDQFFLKISNSSGEFYSYGVDARKRDVFVKSFKKLMQRDDGDIEFVTVTVGVWR